MQLELQKFLFEDRPTRRQLLGYRPAGRERTYKIQVFRNHSFELVEHTIGAYLDYAGIGAEFLYSGYDDSLSFLELDPGADLLLLWIDATRYAGGDIQAFVAERAAQLRTRYEGPILAVPFGADVALTQSGVAVWNLSRLRPALGDALTDERARDVTGTPLSSKALLRISKELGLKYIPALLRPALKAVIVDLDNTLYAGVLGEDGAEGLVLTEGHRRLQETLKRLSKEGFFLCAASKNDLGDVERMLAVREDFPLKKDDFTFISASWDSKALMVRDFADRLNISADSMLFVDDNIGELRTVEAAFPDIRTVHALEDASVTDEILSWYPGLFRLTAGSREDAVRKGDVQANARRREMQRSMSPEEYIRSLALRLVFDYDNPAQLARIAELANKTNQFIFSYRRYTPAEVEERLAADDYKIVTISLSDCLSDSGLIGVCVGRDEGDSVLIEECYISCRALGRGIDDVIVLGAIQGILDHFGRDRARVLFQKGPRNVPAERFVAEKLAGWLDAPAAFSYKPPEGLLTIETVKHS